ncbi:MAG: transcription antitermination factor NusB [Actinobacteria bacterium]|nr:transcription antitermination factor NusB [Actinomycetota bacterium]
MTDRVRRSDTTDPRRSRELALKVLFQADIRREDPRSALERVAADAGELALLDRDADSEDAGAGRPLDGFTRVLVEGVATHRDAIDERITRFARRWSIPRMPVVDRNVLRLATYELLHEDTPPAIVISEAVELAKSLSTDDSGRYVNGVLDAIRKDVEAQPGGAG